MTSALRTLAVDAQKLAPHMVVTVDQQQTGFLCDWKITTVRVTDEGMSHNGMAGHAILFSTF